MLPHHDPPMHHSSYLPVDKAFRGPLPADAGEQSPLERLPKKPRFSGAADRVLRRQACSTTCSTACYRVPRFAALGKSDHRLPLASSGDRCPRSLARRGFSLVELLVVIAIITVLLGLLLPAVQAVRESARRTSCSNNLRNLSMGMLAHHESEGTFPYGFNWLEAFWHGPLLPYIEQQPLFDTLIYDEHNGNWHVGVNEQACATPIAVFRCPSMGIADHFDYNSVANRTPVSYRGCAGSNIYSDDVSSLPGGIPGAKALEEVPLDGIFWGESCVQLADVRDGASHTVLIGESLTDPEYVKDGQGMDYWQFGGPQLGGWVSGGRGGSEFSEAVGSTAVPINSRLDPTQTGWVMEVSFGSWHTGVAGFTFADGSTRFLNEQIDLATYQSLGSRKGGEIPASLD